MASAGGSGVESPRYAAASAVPLQALVDVLDRMEGAPKRQKLQRLVAWWRSLGSRVDLYPIVRLLVPKADTARPTYHLREDGLGKAIVEVLNLAKEGQAAARILHYRLPTSASRNAPAGDFCGIVYDVLSEGRRCGGDSARESHDVQVADARKAGRPDPPPYRPPTVGEANAFLTRLSAAGPKDHQTHVALLREMVLRLTARQLYWMCHVILRDLKINIDGAILECLHPNATAWHNETKSLSKVCERVAAGEEARDGSAAAAAGAGAGVGPRIELFRPFSPMLAADPPASAQILVRLGLPVAVEPKYDGERVLVHFGNGGEVRFFSRNAKDLEERYRYATTIRDDLLACLADNVRSCILDGEFMGYDTARGRFLAFGSNRPLASAMIAAGRRGAAAGAAAPTEDGKQTCYMAFDLLYLNGTLLIDQPLSERRRGLEAVLPADRRRPHRVDVAPHDTSVTTHEDLMAALDRACGEGLEGLVVKKLSSPYMLDQRGDWVKLKPEHVKNMTRNVDCLVMGAYYGDSSRRTGRPVTYLLVVADESKAATAARGQSRPPRAYRAFGKVSTGLNEQQRDDLDRRMAGHLEVLGPADRLPAWFDQLLGGWHPRGDDRPHLLIRPEHSVMLEVKCALMETPDSTKWTAGYTPRFPRVARIRDDKPLGSVCTTAELRDMFEAAGQSMSASDAALLSSAGMDVAHGEGGGDGGDGAGRRGRRLRSGDDAGSPRPSGKRARGVAAAAAAAASVSSLPLAADEAVSVVADVFGGREIMVLNDDPSLPKAELERMVRELGGLPVQSPSPSTWMAVYTKKDILRVQLAASKIGQEKKGHSYSVVHARWLQRCRRERASLPITTMEYDELYVTDKAREEEKKELDHYRDHYWREATPQSLKTSIAVARAEPLEEDRGALDDDMLLEEVLSALPWFRKLFRGQRAYFDVFRTVQTGAVPDGDPLQKLRCPALDAAAARFEAHAGVVVPTLAPESRRTVTHVVVDRNSTVRVAELARLVPDAAIVRLEWVKESVGRREMLHPAGYRVGGVASAERAFV